VDTIPSSFATQNYGLTSDQSSKNIVVDKKHNFFYGTALGGDIFPPNFPYPPYENFNSFADYVDTSAYFISDRTPTAPTCAVLPAAGQGPTTNVAGNDMMGTIVYNVPVNSANITAGKILKLTFATPYSSSVSVTITPRNFDTPLLGATVVDLSTASFSISSPVPTPTGKTYVWDYIVI
jgi:hypothetical protein